MRTDRRGVPVPSVQDRPREYRSRPRLPSMRVATPPTPHGRCSRPRRLQTRDREATGDIGRAPEQRRADALTQLLREHRAAPANIGDRPRIVVTIREQDLRDHAERAGSWLRVKRSPPETCAGCAATLTSHQLSLAVDRRSSTSATHGDSSPRHPQSTHRARRRLRIPELHRTGSRL